MAGAEIEFKATAMEHGFDRHDESSSTNLSCKSTDGVGDVVDATRQDGVDNKSAKEANLEDIKGGVDNNGIGEVKNNENNNNLEIDYNGEEKEDLRDNVELQQTAQYALEGEVNKFAGEPLHVEKRYCEETKEEETIDAKASIGKVNDCEEDYNKDVKVAGELMKIEEKKDFEQTKDRQGEKVLDDLKNGDEKLVEEQTYVDNNIVTDEMDNMGGNNTMLVINDVKSIDSDVKDDREKQGIEEVKDDKDDNIVCILKDRKDMHVLNEHKDDEKKREVETTINEETTKVDEEPKGLKTVEIEAMKGDVTIIEKHEEKESLRSTKDGDENAIEEDNVNEENNGGNTENAIDENKLLNSTNNEETTNFDGEPKGDATINEKHEEKVSARSTEDEEEDATNEDNVNEDNKGNTEKVIDDKRDLIFTHSKETAKPDKEPMGLETVEMEAMKGYAMVNEKHEVKEKVRSMEDEEEDATEEDDFKEDDDEGSVVKVIKDSKVSNSLKRKRERGRSNVEKGKAKENSDSKEKRASEKNAKNLLSTPLSSSRERPVRERKSVERLVEVIEKEPNRAVVIAKGRGTPLKDIPNVAYKLARKKPADLKFLHSALFGRKGKAVDFKNNLLQFSGFAWHESEEKQRGRIKEKLDKCHKETLFDLCNLLDLSVSKAHTKKEEIIVKLLDFIEAPSATTDVMIAEKGQSEKSRKRKRDAKAGSSRRPRGSATEKSMKKSAKTEDIEKSEEKISMDMEDEDDEEEKDIENGIPDEDDAPRQSESDVKETESSEAGEVGKIEGNDSTKGKTQVKATRKQQSSGIPLDGEEVNNSKLSTQVAVKSPVREPSSKPSKVQKDDANEKVFTRKKRPDSPKGSKSRQNVKDRSSGKKEKAAVAVERKSGPSKADLRKTICEILKEVDFNTATFTDILNMLATRYKMDLTSRKPAIKQMIQEELTKMADEAGDDESGEDEDAVKEESLRPAGKKVKA